jgi:hypothetical protein
VARRDDVPPVGATAIAVLVAELRLDMTKVPQGTSVSWAAGHGNRNLAQVPGSRSHRYH